MTAEMARQLDESIHKSIEQNEPLRLNSDYIRHLAGTWKQEVKTCRAEGRSLFGENYLEIRYEDLNENPHKWVGKILDFLGAGCDMSTIQRIVKQNTFEKLSGGRKSGQEDVKSFFRKGVSGDWKRIFTEKDNQIFQEIAGRELESFNYPV
jgi:hypothetical protein